MYTGVRRYNVRWQVILPTNYAPLFIKPSNYSAVLVFSDRRSGTDFCNDSLPWISRIMASFARMGVYNAVFSTATLVLFLASSKTTIYLVFVLPLGRLYSIVGLLTLARWDSTLTTFADCSYYSPFTRHPTVSNRFSVLERRASSSKFLTS